MGPFIVSGIIGIMIASLNFVGSLLYSSRIITPSKITSIALVLAGFIGRLTILSLLFLGLSKVKGIHFSTLLVSFIMSYTFFLILKTLSLYPTFKPFKQKLLER